MPRFRPALRRLVHVLPRLLLLAGLFVAPAHSAGERLRVEILGASDELLANINAHLRIVAAQDRRSDDSAPALTESAIRRLHRAAPDEIAEALRPFGYYEPVVEASLQREPTRGGENLWRARYGVDPGPATKLRRVELALEGAGKDEPVLRRLIANAGLAPGQILRHPAYDQLKEGLLNDAYALGYLDVRFSRSRMDVYPDERVADLALVLDTGPRFYFGDITIEQDILSETFIRNFVAIEAGEPFEPRRLTTLQLALTDSPYFSQVEVNVGREQAREQRVPVRVAASPSRPQRYETSIGYGTDTGPRGGAGVLWRRVNESGHQFRLDTRLSAIQASLASQYKIPIGDVRSEYLDFTADASRRRINDVDATSYEIGSSLNQNRWGGMRRSSLALRREVWAFGEEPTQSATLLTPGLEYSYINADDPLFTRSGFSAEVALTGAAEQVLSEVSFLQARLAARYIRPLGERSRLLLRGEYGATASDDFDRLPPSQRFFNGGAQNVRGYGFQDLSPRDELGNRVGGAYLGTASIEIDRLVYGDFGLALFADAGNASDNADIDWKSAAGIGLRYRTPVGMFRLDFAHPFDDPNSSFAFHISFGPDLQ
ncbi:MAG: autotransporter assembly complex family protein [Halieaceae bacterium]|nr:autotransporter assembly complex family protein [Halieaceae bacterium]